MRAAVPGLAFVVPSPRGDMLRNHVIAAVCSLALGAPAATPEVLETPSEQRSSVPGCVPTIACVANLSSGALVNVEAGTDGRTGDGELVHDGQSIVRYTLSERLEVQFVTNNLYLLDAQRGPVSLAGVQAGLKVGLLAETTRLPSQAVSVHLTVPTWNAGSNDLEAWWYLSKRIQSLRVDLNLMASLTNVTNTPALQGMGTLTLVADVGRGVALFGELYGTCGQTQARRPGAGSLVGVSFAPNAMLSFDLGGELAFHPDARTMTVFAGLTFTPLAREAAAPLPAGGLGLVH